MTDDQTQPPEDRDEYWQDPYVSRRRPDPATPAQPMLVHEGFLGESDRPGHRRLYFTRELDTFAEFRDEDVLAIDRIAVESPPFIGEGASRVTLRREAVVHYTRTRQLRPIDEFDLDVRLSTRRQSGAMPRLQADTNANPCDGGPIEPGSAIAGVCTPAIPEPGAGGEGGGSEHTECMPRTCHTCQTECHACPTDAATCNCPVAVPKFGHTHVFC